MTETDFSKVVFTEPKGEIERDGQVIFRGIQVDQKTMGEDCQLLYSIVTKAHVNEETPHIHDFPIILSFIGTNPDDIYDFDAEIEFYLDGQKQVITKTSVVRVPSGMSHCPLIFKRVGKPLVFLEIHLTDEYKRREVE